MNKLIIGLLSFTLLLGPMQSMQESASGTFKLGVQAASALTPDESQSIQSAKKKSVSKTKKTKKSKKSKKTEAEKKSSDEN